MKDDIQFTFNFDLEKGPLALYGLEITAIYYPDEPSCGPSVEIIEIDLADSEQIAGAWVPIKKWMEQTMMKDLEDVAYTEAMNRGFGKFDRIGFRTAAGGYMFGGR